MLGVAVSGFAGGSSQAATIEPPTYPTVSLDGAAAGDAAGWAVANGGDANGDGAADLIVAAAATDNNVPADSGSAYVIFGEAPPLDIDLGELVADEKGYRIDGVAVVDPNFRNNNLAWSVASAGDVNDDDRDDALIGIPAADPDLGGVRPNAGSVFLVFGRASSGVVDLANLGSQGYRIDGASTGDFAGVSVANAGDVNLDGRPDALIGAYSADFNGRASSGSAYVVFGQDGTDSIDLAALGANGYRIDGAASGASTGQSVDGAGDVNDDGRSDALIGAPGGSGFAYVVFGQSGTGTIDLASLGSQGYRMEGASASDRAGHAVANAGDVNLDGTPDALVGAPYDANSATAGSAYVVFGTAETSPISLGALGEGGYVITGAVGSSDFAGFSVASAGDLNDDGYPDALLGAPEYVDTDPGSVYIVYGKEDSAPVSLDNLASVGDRIDGISDAERMGRSVASVADLNSDGRRELLFGAPFADPNSRADSGSAYVVSWSPLAPPAPPNDNRADAQTLAGDAGQLAATNVGATGEPGEPEHGGPGGASVWFRWVPATGGAVRFDTCDSNFDTLLAVYVGASTTPLVANDDHGPCDLASQVTFTATAGTEYLIAVDGYDGEWGTIDLGWTRSVAPLNLTQPTIAGVPREGQILTGTDGEWVGTAPVTYLYEWGRCNAAATSCLVVAEGTHTYTLKPGDVGSRMRFFVTAQNAVGSTLSNSAATTAVEASGNVRPTTRHRR